MSGQEENLIHRYTNQKNNYWKIGTCPYYIAKCDFFKKRFLSPIGPDKVYTVYYYTQWTF